jgi:tripartite-type tricarboxylate transporter receptor subunit TctC
MRSIFSKWKQVFTVTLLAMALPLSAVAQAYPSKPIKMIVPFPAGGTTDIVARIIAQKMTESMGQPVTVDNKGGAGGNIGADLMAKAAPDGYTIMMHNLSFPLAAVAQALANRHPSMWTQILQVYPLRFMCPSFGLPAPQCQPKTSKNLPTF